MASSVVGNTLCGVPPRLDQAVVKPRSEANEVIPVFSVGFHPGCFVLIWKHLSLNSLKALFMFFMVRKHGMLLGLR